MKKKKKIEEQKDGEAEGATGSDNPGGRWAMTDLDPQKPDSMKPLFENLPNHHQNVKEG